MFRVLTILAAVVALAVTAAPASAGRNNNPFTVDMATEKLTLKATAGPPQPCGIVATKYQDCHPERASSVSSLTDVLISGWPAKARSGKGRKGDQGTATAKMAQMNMQFRGLQEATQMESRR